MFEKYISRQAKDGGHGSVRVKDCSEAAKNVNEALSCNPYLQAQSSKDETRHSATSSCKNCAASHTDREILSSRSLLNFNIRDSLFSLFPPRLSKSSRPSTSSSTLEAPSLPRNSSLAQINVNTTLRTSHPNHQPRKSSSLVPTSPTSCGEESQSTPPTTPFPNSPSTSMEKLCSDSICECSQPASILDSAKSTHKDNLSDGQFESTSSYLSSETNSRSYSTKKSRGFVTISEVVHNLDSDYESNNTCNVTEAYDSYTFWPIFDSITNLPPHADTVNLSYLHELPSSLQRSRQSHTTDSPDTSNSNADSDCASAHTYDSNLTSSPSSLHPSLHAMSPPSPELSHAAAKLTAKTRLLPTLRDLSSLATLPLQSDLTKSQPSHCKAYASAYPSGSTYSRHSCLEISSSNYCDISNSEQVTLTLGAQPELADSTWINRIKSHSPSNLFRKNKPKPQVVNVDHLHEYIEDAVEFEMADCYVRRKLWKEFFNKHLPKSQVDSQLSGRHSSCVYKRNAAFVRTDSLQQISPRMPIDS